MYVSVALYCYHYSIQRARASKIHTGRLPYINWRLDYYDMTEYDLDIPATIKQMQDYNDIMYRFFRWTLSETLYNYLEPGYAERLREISGLKVERLAEIFGVSRTTYYKWISGSPLHNTHREHLLEVLPLMEEAAERLGSPNTMNNWLLTPISPEGKKPVDYLASRQYSIFRGFLLKVRTGREIFRPLPSSSRVHQEISREEAEDARERLRPRAWRDEDDVDIPTSEEHPNENSR